jgi:hypothetical protein
MSKPADSGWRFVLAALPAAFLNAYAVQTLWDWFVSPLGVPLLGYAHAWGIGLLLQYMPSATPDLSERERSFRERVNQCSYLYVKPLMGLGIGWVARWFMG